MATQFWGADISGNVDMRQVPGFVNSSSAYVQWVDYWRKQTLKPKINFIGSQKSALIDSPDFIAAIQTGNSDNFFLEEMGVILEDVSKENLQNVALQLFEMLVTTDEIDEQDSSNLVKNECEKLIRNTRLFHNPNFKKSQHLYPTITRGSITKVVDVEFSYSYGNGSPKWIGERVPMKRFPKQLKKEVDAVCFRFQQVFTNDMIDQDQATTFIFPTEEQATQPHIREAIDTLKFYSKVVDLRQPEEAIKEFEKVASIPISKH